MDLDHQRAGQFISCELQAGTEKVRRLRPDDPGTVWGQEIGKTGLAASGFQTGQ